MRFLIGALCAVAVLFGVAPRLAAAATVGCGRVTTFVAPNSAGALLNSDGWVIFFKPDGTSDKVILRTGTQTGVLSGYICVATEGVYLTALIAPGSAGYVPEPAEWLPADTVVYCGTVAANPTTFGQGSGPRTYELRVTSGPPGGRGAFSVPESIPLPAVGDYICGRFARGAPMMGLLAVLGAGDSGYVAAGLPNTSTDPESPWLSSLIGLVSLTALGLLVARFRRAVAA